MIELGQLNANHEKFAGRGVRIVAASLDDVENSARTKKKFPNLTILADWQKGLSKAAEVIGDQKGPDGEPTDSPTTFLIDKQGQVRWIFRPTRFLERLPTGDLLDAVDRNLK